MFHFLNIRNDSINLTCPVFDWRLPKQQLFDSQYNSSKAELITVMLYDRVSQQLVQSTSDTLEAFPIVPAEHCLHPFKYEQITSKLNSISVELTW